jgi:acyl-[acyl-carrier-protein]-phospholipid O-acyltransferase/long-chain-fatty-acid--[acyl-carrier-protein] ligase
MSALLEARKTFGGKTIALWDADDRQLSYDEIVRASFALGSALRKHAKPKEKIGIMLPTGVGAVLAFFAIHAFGRVPAMLNFTSGARREAGGADRRALDGREDRLPRGRAREPVAGR